MKIAAENPITLTVNQDEGLDAVIADITKSFPIRYIICWAINQEKLDNLSCFNEDHRHKKHFFLLVISTENTRIEFELQDYVNQKYRSESFVVTLISHGYQTSKEAIENGSYFFSTVCKNGLLFYSPDGSPVTMEYPIIDKSKVLSTARKQFDHRYLMAEGFLMAAESCLDNDHNNHAVFLLHQCIEQACIGMIRVFLAYRTKTHKITRLLDLCSSFSPEAKAFFFSGSGNQEQMTELLQKSYSDARYQEDYKVSSERAESFCRQAHGFLALMKRLCEERLRACSGNLDLK